MHTPTQGFAPRLVALAAVDDDDRVWLRVAGGPATPALVLTSVYPDDLRHALAAGTPVLVLEAESNDQETRSVVVGVAAERATLPAAVTIEAAERVLVRAGDARIQLTADGRVETRGTYVLSRSSGPNKIKGASVQIN